MHSEKQDVHWGWFSTVYKWWKIFLGVVDEIAKDLVQCCYLNALRNAILSALENSGDD